MSEHIPIQSDQFGQQRNIRVAAGIDESKPGYGPLFASLLFFVPVLPLVAAGWGWMAQKRIGRDPNGTGRIYAFAAIAIGLLVTVAQVGVVGAGYQSWHRAQHGLTDALAPGSDRDARLVAALDPDVGTAVDPRAIKGFQRMLEHRYGAFVDASCQSATAGVPLIGGGDAVPFELKFADATLRADVTLVPAALGEDRARWAKVRSVVIHDPEVGEIAFPPPPRTAKAASAPAPPTAVADVPVNP